MRGHHTRHCPHHSVNGVPRFPGCGVGGTVGAGSHTCPPWSQRDAHGRVPNAATGFVGPFGVGRADAEVHRTAKLTTAAMVIMVMFTSSLRQVWEPAPTSESTTADAGTPHSPLSAPFGEWCPQVSGLRSWGYRRGRFPYLPAIVPT